MNSDKKTSTSLHGGWRKYTETRYIKKPRNLKWRVTVRAPVLQCLAAAGMTRLKKLDLSCHDDMNPYLFTSCETWMQLDLPEPPCEIVANVKKWRFGGWISYLSSEDDDALIRALLFEVQGRFSPALALHGSLLLQRTCTLGGDHPRNQRNPVLARHVR